MDFRKIAVDFWWIFGCLFKATLSQKNASENPSEIHRGFPKIHQKSTTSQKHKLKSTTQKSTRNPPPKNPPEIHQPRNPREIHRPKIQFCYDPRAPTSHNSKAIRQTHSTTHHETIAHRYHKQLVPNANTPVTDCQ